ncbi:C39 family peptidase [Paenibacillus lentus]|uniref:C39 family peptidase n=1 Tax=Paenibacillus lentus TaxID=1338368 RepID=UPI001FEAC235|nr:C39 family peptidase [Paenibacillus lentus]
MAKRTYSVDLNTPSFKQFNDGNNTWYSKKTSCGGTIGQEGCFLTSAAMIFKGFGDTVDPGSITEALKKKNNADCPFNWNTAASEYSHTWHNKTNGSFNNVRSNLFDLIVTQRVPVMVHVPNHMVVVKGFQGTLTTDIDGLPYYTDISASMFKVNDPGSSSNSTLQDVINQKGSVDYITYYTK